MAPQRPPWENLPARSAERAAALFQTLGCEDAPLDAASSVLVDVAGDTRGATLGRVFLAIAAAIHAAARYPGLDEPLASPDEPLAETPAAWLLLAARASAGTNLDAETNGAIDRALGAVIGALDDERGGSRAPERPSPLADYALSILLPAAAGRAGDERLTRAGAALGRLTRLAQELRALGGGAVTAPRPRLLGQIAKNAGQDARFALALANAHAAPADRLALLACAGSPALAPHLAAAVAAETLEIQGALEGEAGATLTRAAETLAALATRAAASMRLFGLTSSRPPTMEVLERTLALSRDALASDPDLRESWEVHRWGGIFEKTTVARLFPVGLCLLALSEAGVDVSDRAAELVSSRRVDGFRYYEDFDRIPPDIDDLGLGLRLVALLPEDHASRRGLDWPIELVTRAQNEDGEIPVWLDRDLKEPVPEGAPTWLGSRCLAATANLLIGMTSAGLALPEAFFDQALGWITRTWEAEGAKASYFYGAPFTVFLLAELARAAEKKAGDAAPRARLRAIVDDIEASITSSRRDDGGHGGVLATACHLGVLALGRREPFDPWPEVTYLAARQEADGLFPREPLYLGPGKDGRTVGHGARTLNAAVCLRALALAKTRIQR